MGRWCRVVVRADKQQKLELKKTPVGDYMRVRLNGHVLPELVPPRGEVLEIDEGWMEASGWKFLKGLLNHMFNTQDFPANLCTIHDGRELMKESGLTKAEFFAKYNFVCAAPPVMPCGRSPPRACTRPLRRRRRRACATLALTHPRPAARLSCGSLLDHKTAMEPKDWEDDDAIAKVYDAECEELCKAQLGKPECIYGSTGRLMTRGPPLPGAKEKPMAFYGIGIHGDYPLDKDMYLAPRCRATHNSGQLDGNSAARFEEMMAREDIGRFERLNFWRPIKPMQRPLRHMPLLVCDPNTVWSERLHFLDFGAQTGPID
eukprot:3356228-Prymnesium_polylepis.1